MKHTMLMLHPRMASLSHDAHPFDTAHRNMKDIITTVKIKSDHEHVHTLMIPCLIGHLVCLAGLLILVMQVTVGEKCATARLEPHLARPSPAAPAPQVPMDPHSMGSEPWAEADASSLPVLAGRSVRPEGRQAGN